MFTKRLLQARHRTGPLPARGPRWPDSGASVSVVLKSTSRELFHPTVSESAAVLNAFTLLCEHHHRPSPQPFHLAERTPYSRPSSCWQPFCFLPLTLTTLSTSQEWNRTVTFPLGPAQCPQVHWCCSLRQNVLPFKAEFHCMDIPRLLDPFICQQILWSLQPLGCCEECSYEHKCTEMVIFELGRLRACLLQ